MKVSAQYAATHFDDIVSAASSGEEVEIAVPNKPSLKLVVAHSPVLADSTGRRISGGGRRHLFGAGEGLVTVPTPEQWDALDELAWQQPERPRSEVFGSLAGKMEFAADWDSPETNNQIQDLLEGLESSSRER